MHRALLLSIEMNQLFRCGQIWEDLGESFRWTYRVLFDGWWWDTCFMFSYLCCGLACCTHFSLERKPCYATYLLSLLKNMELALIKTFLYFKNCVRNETHGNNNGRDGDIGLWSENMKNCWLRDALIEL